MGNDYAPTTTTTTSAAVDLFCLPLRDRHLSVFGMLLPLEALLRLDTHAHTHFTSIDRITALCAGRLNAPGIRLSATPPSKQSHRPHQIDYYSTIGDAFVNTFAQTRTHTLRFLLSPGVFPLTTTAFLPTICRDSAAHTYTRMHTLTSSLTYTRRALYAALCRNPCLASSII